MQGAFDTKDATASAHAGITQATAYYPYDPTLGQYQYDRYVVSFVRSVIISANIRPDVGNYITYCMCSVIQCDTGWKSDAVRITSDLIFGSVV